jgi:hypothetical protein
MPIIPSRSFRLALLLSASTLGGIHPAGRGGEKELRQQRLFVITRNLNDNMVCYDACIRGSKLDAKEPVRVYWTIPKEKNKIEDLTRMERSRAYGFDVVKSYGGDSVDIALKPLPRPMRVKRHDGRWVAVMKIDSVQAALTSAYVMADNSGLIPTVQWIKLTGKEVSGGRHVTETLKP